MLKHLRHAKSKGRAPLFIVSKQNLNPPIGASRALKMVQNEIELKKHYYEMWV
jgi:hypothetical protein